MFWRHRTQMKTLLTLMIGVVMLAFAAFQSLISQSNQREAAKWASHSFEILLLTENWRTNSSLVDQRAREFIYRRTPSSRPQFNSLAKTIEENYAALSRMTADSPEQSKQIQSARKHSLAQIEYLSKNVERYRTIDGHITDKMRDLAAANQMTFRVQSEINKISSLEYKFLTARQSKLEAAQNVSTLWMFIFLISGGTVIAFSFRSAVLSNMTLAQKARLEERERRAEELRLSESRANEQSRLLSALNTASANLASEHDLQVIVQDVVDYGVGITGAEYGAFFFVLEREGKAALHLEALSGNISRESFPETDYLRATELFVSHTNDILISDDIQTHETYARSGRGCPVTHPQVRSYIGIPIISAAGNQIGSLLFGHSEPAKFTSLHEQTVKGLAGITSIVIENAHLYSAAQRELEERIRYEQELVSAANRQSLLLRELNHRVKNTLVTVQSIAMQTKNAAISKLGIDKDPIRLANLNRFYSAFESRLLSLSGTHDLLVNGAWGDVLLSDALWAAVKPLIDSERVKSTGPDIWLSPNTAVTLNMLFHELSTNAIKYGAISVPEGHIEVTWYIEEDMLRLLWKEVDGPLVKNPDGIGFGSKLLDRAVRREMKGMSSMAFLPEGIECYMEIPLSQHIRQTK